MTLVFGILDMKFILFLVFCKVYLVFWIVYFVFGILDSLFSVCYVG